MNQNFFPAQHTHRQTAQGFVDLPILYYDTSAFYAFFDVALGAAETILAGTGLIPVPLPGGRTIAGIAAYEYRATSVGVYNEVGLAIAAVPASTPLPALSLLDLILPSSFRRLGFYIADLPVTTEKANAAGREIWGYPKFVTPIPLKYADGKFDLKVMHPESPAEHIMQLSGNYAESVHLPNIDLNTWTNLGSDLLATQVTTRGKAGYSLRPAMTLSVGARGHRMQQHLQTLQLDGRQPLAFSASHDFQSILPEGVVYATVGERPAELAAAG